MFDPVSLSITGIIIAIMFYVAFATPKQRRAGNTLPTLLTSIGIFGTFFGIVYGLLGFDVSDPQNSITQLLDGLRIAFITSIFGIGFAIVLKWRYSLKAEEDTTEGATADTLSSQLKEILKSINTSHTDSVKHLQAIETSLVGDGESTLITQLQKLRTGLSDTLDRHAKGILTQQVEAHLQLRNQAKAQHEQLISEFKTFAEKMADNNSKALIEALEDVMRDFNAKINEQFGDNFKQLNEAVGKILDWQEQYRQQMIDLIDRFNKSGESFDNIDKNLREINDQVSTVMELVDELDSFMKTAQVHLEGLQRSVAAHANMAKKAENAFPIIERNMKDITEGMSQSVQEVIKSSEQSVKSLQSSLEEQSAFLEQHTKQVAKASNKVFEELGDTIQKLIEQNNSRITGQFKQFHESMEGELNKAIGSMGSHLSSLSNRLVGDYGPLTEQLRKLIEATDGDGRR